MMKKERFEFERFKETTLNGGTITWSILSRVANVSRGVKGPRPELPDFRGQLHFSSVPTPFQRPYTTLRTQVKDFFPTVGHDISTTAENTLCPRQYTTNLRTLERGFDTFWQSVTFLHLMTENWPTGCSVLLTKYWPWHFPSRADVDHPTPTSCRRPNLPAKSQGKKMSAFLGGVVSLFHLKFLAILSLWLKKLVPHLLRTSRKSSSMLDDKY
jgi:hypothetical protein